uniref:Kinetochore protein SPC25 n=1 Tax=Oryza punctata TaxID=4537 RepID=A0A0E0JU89_ORYPU
MGKQWKSEEGNGGGGGAIEIRDGGALYGVRAGDRRLPPRAFGAARSLADHTTPYQYTAVVLDLKDKAYELTGESISNTTATNEHLRSLEGSEGQERRICKFVISNQLEAIEALEAKSDATGKKNLEEAIMWYKRFLGFQVVGGEGVKFVFNKIGIQNPGNEYSFCIKLNKDRYNHDVVACLVLITVLHCAPFLKDSEELVKDLNCSNDMFKFVRIMREKFQAAAINGTP